MTSTGIYTIDADKYHADPCEFPSLSASMAKILLSVHPRAAWLAHPRLNPNHQADNQQKFSLGTAAHDLLLEGGTAKIHVINPEDYPAKNGNIPAGWTNDAIRGARDDAYAAGLTPILQSEYADVERMAERARDAIAKCPELGGRLLGDGLAEQTLIWRENMTDCRARVDWLSHDHHLRIDYKTTTAASPADWIRKYIAQMGHDVQDDFHNRGVFATTGVHPRSLFLVQQDFGEFDCFFVELSAAMKEIGRIKVERALATWRTCLARDHWPAWGDEIYEAEATAWQLAEAEEMAAEMDYSAKQMADFDKNSPGAKEAFMFGNVPEKQNNFTHKGN